MRSTLYTHLLTGLRLVADGVAPAPAGETKGDAVNRRLYALAHAGLIVWAAGFAALYIAQGVPFPVQVSAVTVTLCGAALVMAYRSGVSLHAGAWAAAAILFMGHIAPALYLGGANGPAAVWLAIVPLVGIALGQQRVAVATFCAVAAYCLLLGWLELHGMLPVRMLPGDVFVRTGPVNTIGASLFLLVLGQVAHATLHKRAVHLQATNSELVHQIAERTAAETALAEAQRQLISVARSAGRAEVAAGVLHNVGNALNGVTVGTAQVERHVRSQRVSRVADLAGLLDTLDDPRYAEYARKLAAELERSQRTILSELADTREAAEQATQVVATQQHIARQVGVSEWLCMQEATREAALLADVKPPIQLDIGEAPPPVFVDRHRVVQILANLLSNARDAVSASESPHIRVQFFEGLGELTVQVQDNGAGVPTDLRDCIFHHGFSTKTTSAGVGLHAAALAATELGGALAISEAPVGTGAQFELTLPRSFPSMVAGPGRAAHG